MSSICNKAADKIEQQIAKMSEGVFHIVSEDVKKEQVSAYVEDVGVEEEGCEECVKIFSLNNFGWNHGEIVVNPVCK